MKNVVKEWRGQKKTSVTGRRRGDLDTINLLLCCVLPVELSLMQVVLLARWTCSKRLSC